MTMLTQDMREQIAAEEVTLKNGYWFVFRDGDDEVAINASAWSGKERYYINGELVAENRSLVKTNRAFRFTHNENAYEIRIKTTNTLTSEWECTALKNDKIIGIASKTYYEGTTGQILKKFLPLFLIGSIGGTLFVTALVFIAGVSSSFIRGFFLGTVAAFLAAVLLMIAVNTWKRR